MCREGWQWTLPFSEEKGRRKGRGWEGGTGGEKGGFNGDVKRLNKLIKKKTEAFFSPHMGLEMRDQGVNRAIPSKISTGPASCTLTW